MARAVLLAGAVLWTLAGMAGFAAALIGAEAVVAALPPLAIDVDALRGALVAIAAGCLTVGVVHVAALVSLGRAPVRGRSAAILLLALLAVVFVALAAAAFTTAAVDSARSALFVAGGIGAVLAALAYGFATLKLVLEQRSESAS